MAGRREQGFYSTLVSVSSVDILPNTETKSKIKKKKKKKKDPEEVLLSVTQHLKESGR